MGDKNKRKEIPKADTDLEWPSRNDFKKGGILTFSMLVIFIISATLMNIEEDKREKDTTSEKTALHFLSELITALSCFTSAIIIFILVIMDITARSQRDKEKQLKNAERKRLGIENKAKKFEEENDYLSAITIWRELNMEDEAIRVMKNQAYEREKARDYEPAIHIWENLGEIEEAARVRKLQAELGSVKVAQKVVQGDEVTEIKDSVINRSNVGGGTSKMQELEKLTEMKKEGLIDDDEFKQMKKEILGK